MSAPPPPGLSHAQSAPACCVPASGAPKAAHQCALPRRSWHLTVARLYSPTPCFHGCSVALNLQNVCTNSEAACDHSTVSCTICSHDISSSNPRLAAVHQTNASVIVTVSASWHNAIRADRFRHLIVVCHHLNAAPEPRLLQMGNSRASISRSLQVASRASHKERLFKFLELYW